MGGIITSVFCNMSVVIKGRVLSAPEVVFTIRNSWIFIELIITLPLSFSIIGYHILCIFCFSSWEFFLRVSMC